MDPQEQTGTPSSQQPQLPQVPFPAVPQQPAAGESAQNAGQPAGQPMTLPLPPNPGQIDVQNAPQIDVSATTQMSTPQVIDDGDLIEKEWVNKAKQIVARNRSDPYKQSEELMVLRADYMQKRYNKTIKLSK
jgi:hypothetical protein